MKNTHGGVLLLVKLQALKPFNTSKINSVWQDRIIILLVHQCQEL